MADLGPLRVPRRADRPSGLQARLRSLFAVPAWGKRPEPRVRYGEPFLPGVAALGRQHLAEARPLLERAEAVRGRRFEYFGRTVAFPGQIDWEPQGLPTDWTVALNALDDLIPLGVAAALAPTMDVRARWYAAAIGLVREWTGTGEPGSGVGWQPPALARRIPNLIHSYIFFGRELRADPPARKLFLDGLYAQAVALAAAVRGVPQDHRLIAAGRALFFAGRFFDGMEARGWLDAGSTILWHQLREQVHEDGGHRARTPVVHALVLADYLELVAFIRAANDDVPPWALKRVKTMADFLARIVHPDDELPLFHRSALGVARPARELLATAAVVLHEPALASPGDLPGIWPLLVVGEGGRRRHASLPRSRPPTEPRALRRTNYYVLPGDPGDVMLLDGGTPPADGDAGVLGYELSVGGSRLIVGSGVGDHEPDPWRGFFGTRRAHNTVVCDDADETTPTGDVSDVRWIMRDGLLFYSGTWDGGAGAEPRIRHRRRVFCMPGRFWLVADELLGSGAVEAESMIHLHPDVRLAAGCRGAPGFAVSRSPDASVAIVAAGVHEVRVVHGVDGDRPQGWYAPRHGERRAAPALALVAIGRLPLVVGYALLPRFAGAAELAFQHDAFQLQATLRLEGREYRMTVLQDDIELAISG